MSFRNHSGYYGEEFTTVTGLMRCSQLLYRLRLLIRPTLLCRVCLHSYKCNRGGTDSLTWPFNMDRMCHAKSPMALFSMFMYIMHGTFAIPECESTLHHLNFRSLKQDKKTRRTKMWDFWRDRSCGVNNFPIRLISLYCQFFNKGVVHGNGTH